MASPLTNPASRALAEVPCCICHDFTKSWRCVQCDDSFCDKCWDEQRPHLPGKVGIDGRQHEKVDLEVIERLSKIFDQPSQEEQHDRHLNDINTTWFGVTNEANQSYLHYSNRLIDILQESQMGDYSERFPHLVSFVGQTGGGKSTIIRMLINREQARSNEHHDYPAPIPGLVGDNMPTTGDVHLYADPSTYHERKPILYADCEGMAGGESTPRGLEDRCEGKKKTNKPHKPHKPHKQHKRSKIRKRLTWATDPQMRSREYAVKKLFPRILYTFSDVIVFTLREVRTFQTEVLRQLISWAATSIDKSINQPTLPHIIIVINGTEPSIDEKLWDTKTATDSLLGDYERSVHQVAELQDILTRVEQHLNKKITTSKELLEYYYSSVTVIRVPFKGRYMQIDDQIGKLYDAIHHRCAKSYAQKEVIRMLLNAELLPKYVNAAYDHFSQRLDVPFDFAEEARRHAPLPQEFGGHILNFISSMYNLTGGQNPDARGLLKRLGLPIASCIMLAATRDNLQGSYSGLLKTTYQESLREAFMDFCNHWVRCSFVKDGLQCCNARRSHGKGHQASTGKILSRGAYQAAFDPDSFFHDWIKEIDKSIHDQDTMLLQLVDRDTNTLSNYHSRVMADYFLRTSLTASRIKSNLTCLCCLRKIPESVLPCGHILCKSCVQAASRNVGQGVFELYHCPLHPGETQWSTPARIMFKPFEAGVRVLCLDGGGVRGIIELLILQAIEKELGSHIPIQNFFDLIVGTSTGGIIALGLGVKRWSVSDCLTRFKSLCQQAFTGRAHKSLRAFTFIGRKSFYKTTPLENALKSAFGGDSFLYGEAKPESPVNIRVAVTSTNAMEKKPVIMSNYNTGGARDGLPYAFIRQQSLAKELKIWEAARATSAAPPYFKPFIHQETGEAYTDGAIHHNCPVSIADDERRLLWEEASDWPTDIMLSIGTGLSPTGTIKHYTPSSPTFVHEKTHQEPAKLRKWVSNHSTGLNLSWWAAQAIVENQLNCEEAWRKHCSKAAPPGRTLRTEDVRRNLRLNVHFSDPRPPLDEIETLENTERTVINYLLDDPFIRDEIHEVAHKLVASSFYFERRGPGWINRTTGVCQYDGNIRCRFLDHSDDLKGLGHVLRSCIRGTAFVPYFFLQENYDSPDEKSYEVPILHEKIDEMCEHGIFQLTSALTIEAANISSITRLSLRLQEHVYYLGEGYGLSTAQRHSMEPFLSISGFPRNLWTAGSSHFYTSDSQNGNEEEEEEAVEGTGEDGPFIKFPVPDSLVDDTEATSTKSSVFRRAFSRSHLRMKPSLSLGSMTSSSTDDASPGRNGKFWSNRVSIERWATEPPKMHSISENDPCSRTHSV